MDAPRAIGSMRRGGSRIAPQGTCMREDLGQQCIPAASWHPEVWWSQVLRTWLQDQGSVRWIDPKQVAPSPRRGRTGWRSSRCPAFSRPGSWLHARQPRRILRRRPLQTPRHHRLLPRTRLLRPALLQPNQRLPRQSPLRPSRRRHLPQQRRLPRLPRGSLLSQPRSRRAPPRRGPHLRRHRRHQQPAEGRLRHLHPSRRSRLRPLHRNPRRTTKTTRTGCSGRSVSGR